jgi:hypothetical protein
VDNVHLHSNTHDNKDNLPLKAAIIARDTGQKKDRRTKTITTITGKYFYQG